LGQSRRDPPGFGQRVGLFFWGEQMPHLAIVAFTVIAIVLILIFVRFRFDKHFAKIVYLTLDVLIVVLLISLLVICFRFSAN
jgi:multisubunit Na+/H+ antiporter MnhB subunit